MAHAIWKGSISFGLVNIPGWLYSADISKELKLSLLDKKDLSPIGNRRVNKRTGKEVPLTEIVRGYEYEEGRYVVLGSDEYRLTDPKSTQTIEILDFVDAVEIHPIYM